MLAKETSYSSLDFISANSFSHFFTDYYSDSKFFCRRVFVNQTNKQIAPELESIFLLTAPAYTPITSTIVRDIIRHGGDASQFLPYDINDETI